MVKEVKSQHYIPQMYLKRFCNSNGLLDVYDKTEKNFEQNLPKAFAHKKFFYDIDPEIMRELLDTYYPGIDSQTKKDLSNTQAIEKMLSRIEGDADQALKKIDCDFSKIREEKVEIPLVLFLQALSLRTIAQRKQIENIHCQTANWLKNFNIPAKSDLGIYCNSTPEEYAKKWQINMLLSPRESLKFAHKLEENYDWYLGIATSPLKLIISDNPAQMIGFGFNDCCFPISPTKAIIFRAKGEDAKLLSQDKPKNGIIHLSQRSVFIYNLIQAAQANRFLFGDKQSMLFSNTIEGVSEILSNNTK